MMKLATKAVLRSTLFLAIATAAPLTGCTTKHQQVSPHRLELPQGMVALALDVSNFNGTITVHANNADADAVLIEAERFAAKANGKRESIAALETIELTSDLESEGPLGVVRIAATTTHETAEQLGVNLNIRMPRCDGVQIRNAGGYVSVTDAGGTVDIYNEGGSIEFRTSRRMTEPVTLITHEGEVYYQVPLESTGRFDMLTLEGRTTLRDRGAIVEETYVGRGELQFHLNEGENPIVMRTNRGNVRAWIMEDPLALTRALKKDKPDYRDRWYLQSTRRHTRNLPYETEYKDPPSVSLNDSPWNRVQNSNKSKNSDAAQDNQSDQGN